MRCLLQADLFNMPNKHYSDVIAIINSVQLSIVDSAKLQQKGAKLNPSKG
jgi:hypothetical protein